MRLPLWGDAELLSSTDMANARSARPAFRFVDLFAGVGGFHHALAPMGGECVLAVEVDLECRTVYQAAFPEMDRDRIVTDIRQLTRESSHPDAPELSVEEIRRRVPPHEVLCAGFPCQPFSKSGSQMGFRDRTRGTLFYDVMTIVLARSPEYVLLENVRNLAGPRHADTWRTIIKSLREAGYRVADEPAVLSPHLLAPEDGGAPQMRERVFILARRVLPAATEEARQGVPLAPRQPSKGWDPHRWDIRTVLDVEVPLDVYGIRAVERGWLAAWQAFVQGIDDEILPGFPIWVDAFRAVPHVPAGTPWWEEDFLHKNSYFYRRHRRFIDPWLKQRWGPIQERVTDFPPSRRKFEWQARRAQATAASRDLDGLVAHLRPSGIRVKPPSYLPALVAITQTSVLGPKVTGSDWRRLTPREAARLQGMPFEGFERAAMGDKAIYRQLGNAVNVGVVQHLADLLFEDGAAPWACASRRISAVG